MSESFSKLNKFDYQMMESFSGIQYSRPDPAEYNLNVTHEGSLLDGFVYEPVIKVINSSLPNPEDLMDLAV